jgi:hypothetical protein
METFFNFSIEGDLVPEKGTIYKIWISAFTNNNEQTNPTLLHL